MKAAGYNAIRIAHNPASKATLDAADRLGTKYKDQAAWDDALRQRRLRPAQVTDIIIKYRLLLWKIIREYN
jgi:hypothetical protein